jgi:AcrR family transcriptional regulator
MAVFWLTVLLSLTSSGWVQIESATKYRRPVPAAVAAGRPTLGFGLDERVCRLMDSTREERVRRASRERRKQQKQEVRQAILDAAAALFVEHGYSGFSLRQVAERIGYSATTIYLYFEDKDDLLFTVADEGFTRFGACIAEAAREPDPLARLEAIGRAYIAFGLANPSYYALMFIDRGDFLLGYRGGERKPRIGALNVVEQAVREGIDAGQIRPGAARSYASALWAAVHGVVAMAIALPAMGQAHVDATAEAVLQLMVTGLRADAH